MARPKESYRAARRNDARNKKMVWRDYQRQNKVEQMRAAAKTKKRNAKM